MAQQVSGKSKKNVAPGDILLVVHDFQARSNDELSLSKGDRIELIERDDDFGDGWYLGRHMQTQQNGLFPEVYTTVVPKPSNTITQPNNTQVFASDRGLENGLPKSKHAAAPAVLSGNAISPVMATNVQKSVGGMKIPDSEDSPVMNETLSVIDEHMTDMNIPRLNGQGIHRHLANDSGSEYSTFLDHRISYITGQETDEEEHNGLTEGEVMEWTPAQVAEHLEDIGVETRHCQVFKEQDITGEVLLAMDQASIFMKEFDLGLVGQRLRTWHKIKALQDEVRSSPTPVLRGKAGPFGGDSAYDSAAMNGVLTTTSSSTNVSHQNAYRSSPNLAALKQDFMNPPLSPALSFTQSQVRDTISTPSSFTFKTGPESPTRPSAASIRNLHHSRRHSAADFVPALPASSSDLGNVRRQSGMAIPTQSSHRKNPSLDRNWTMGHPITARPISTASPSIGGYGSGLSPRDASSRLSPQSFDGARDSERGYKSGDEGDGKKARNLLRKKDPSSTGHSRQSSYQNEGKRSSTAAPRRHSRFGSVDSIRDTMAAIAGPTGRMSGIGKGHFRTSSANETTLPKSESTGGITSPTVTKLEYDNNAAMKPISSPKIRDSDVSINHSPKSATSPTKAKPQMGLRAISDAVTNNEKAVVTSPSSVPSPVRESMHQPPARTGSTTPSGASANMDRESTDASSKGTSAAQAGLTSSMVMRRKTKKETSAYARGLEKKAPQEQMKDCDYSGWMKKKSSNIMATWKPRLFVLRGRRLSYYYSDSDTEEKGLIDISSHRVLPADNDILTGIHATVTGAKSSPVSPLQSHTPTLAATEAAAQVESSLQRARPDATFIFKLVPPRTGLSRAVNFTKPTIHYFAVDNVRQGRLWMAALMKATIDRDETQPISTSYQLKTISLAKARSMKQRPPALMNQDETADQPAEEVVEEEGKTSANPSIRNVSAETPLSSASAPDPATIPSEKATVLEDTPQSPEISLEDALKAGPRTETT